MSVIGPRPLLVEYLPYYTKEEHHRHDVMVCICSVPSEPLVRSKSIKRKTQIMYAV